MKRTYTLMLIIIAVFTVNIWARPTLDFNNKPMYNKAVENSSNNVPVWANMHFNESQFSGRNRCLNEAQMLNANKSAESEFNRNSLPVYVTAPQNSTFSSNSNSSYDGSSSSDCSILNIHQTNPNIDLTNSIPDSTNCAPAYVPAPGALLLGCSGMLLISWLRRRLR